LSLVIGASLGPYQILAPLGVGGMGEVYRARDTKLNRDVAVKILPDAFANDPDRLARFTREAQTLAALNHPHIAHIHGLEESGGVRALVMELVEGEDLAQQIARGAIPLDEALPIAKQIAEALEAAHEQGIIHRDLKPANVKIRPDGTVKVLDFGLAKALDPIVVGGGLQAGPLAAMNSPTIMSPAAMTGAGIILGTAAYMSPEQARGKNVDKRADIWAFGCVLFEMLAGRPTFAGESVTDIVAAVVKESPDWSALPADTPRAIRRLLQRCLEKDPRQRLRDIGDARLELEAARVMDDVLAPVAAAPAELHSRRSWLPWAIAAIAVVSAAGFAWRGRVPGNDSARWESFTQLTDQTGEEDTPALSPDGSTIAYASRARGTWDIYAQRVGGRNPIVIAGDAKRNERSPAFSPDGASLAFHESDSEGGIFVAGATGESTRRLTDFGFHPAWSPDGRRIVFCTEEITDPYSRSSVSALWIVDAAGGSPKKIFEGDAAEPAWSPSGARIAFFATIQGQRDLFTIPAEGGTAAPVMNDAPLDWGPAWSPDGRFLYFASDRGGSMNLWRIGIDQPSGHATGTPEPVTTGVQVAADLPTLSRDGARLVFRSRLAWSNPAVIPLDPAAERLDEPKPLVQRTGILFPTGVSPDGAWLALGTNGDRREDVFVCRADGSELRRIMDDVFRDRGAVWTPDGSRLAFYSNRSGRYQIWTIKPDGSALTRISDVADGELLFPLYSPKGDRLIASVLQTGVRNSLLFDLAKSSPTAPVELRGVEVAGGHVTPMVWSPDGRRVAGPIVSSGGRQIGVAVYDLAARKTTKISDDDSNYAVGWLPDSRRLITLNGDTEIVLLDADTGRRRVLTMPKPFRIRDDALVVAPDGKAIYVGALQAEADVWMVTQKVRSTK